MNLDSLLDGTLDALADKPEFKPFPAGMHVVQTFFKEVQFGEKGKDGAGIEVKFKYQSVGELADPEETPPKQGDETSIQLNITSKNETQREFAQGTLKDILSALKAKFPGATSPRELMAEGNGADAAIVTTLRPNKDKSQFYLQLGTIEYI